MLIPVICPVCPTKHKSREFYIDIELDPHGDIIAMTLVCARCGAKWVLKPQVTRVKIGIVESPHKRSKKVLRC